MDLYLKLPCSTDRGLILPIFQSANVFLSNTLVSRTVCGLGDVTKVLSQASTKLPDASGDVWRGTGLDVILRY